MSRVDGRVVFVRHALPGERVLARVTEERRSYWRADAVSVLSASDDRVEPPCPFARPDLCGGCDLQHASAPAQLAWKSTVVGEHLGRPVPVSAVPGGLLGWRTRVRYAVSPDGVAGLRKHRSHEVVPVDQCRIASAQIQTAPVLASRRWLGVNAVEVVASSRGDLTILGDGRVVSGPSRVREYAAGREWTVDAGAFWQVHPAAADTLAATVLDLLGPVSGQHVWDLYGGAGLFAGALTDAGARVTLVESDRRSVAAARRNVPGARVVAGPVERVLPRLDVPAAVVLDPPRTGARAAVVRGIVAAAPRAVVYVACDPAAFARDVATFGSLGWTLADVRAFDLFPMTHHVECVGLLGPDQPANVAACLHSSSR